MKDTLKGVQDPRRVAEYGYLTIKERLLNRFMASKKILGKNWRFIIAANDPFFHTKVGHDFTTAVGQALSDHSRGNVDRIERVVVAMEKAARKQPSSVV